MDDDSKIQSFVKWGLGALGLSSVVSAVAIPHIGIWVALFILALVFGVLRPLLNNLTGVNKRKEPVAVEGGSLGDLGNLSDELPEDELSLSGSAQQIMLSNPTDGYEAQLNAIKTLVAENPGRVAEVVKEWINGDE
jgi:flagellar M-ring protein FliF